MLERIGKYEIRKEIGRGAMGAVYEGFDTVLGRRVAVKKLRMTYSTQRSSRRCSPASSGKPSRPGGYRIPTS